jgi:MoaA/NifB/PqqE/SkfB family radical SAM enzyme
MYRQVIVPKIRQQRLLHDVSLELTYGCNLDCFFCYNDRDKPGTPLSLEQYQTLLGDLAKMQTMFLMLTGGEPMLHPHFFEIGAMARELGFVTRVRTNGHNLGLRNARRLRKEVDPHMVEVSLHGASAEVHDRQTRVGGSFVRLLKNIRTASSEGLRCSVVSTPTAWNEHQIEDMFVLCDSLNVPLRFQGPVAPRDNGDREPLSIQPSADAWYKVAKELAVREVRDSSDTSITGLADNGRTPQIQSTCSVGVAGLDIDPYGNIQACMHLQRSAGNLHQYSIREIWENSPLFTEARERAIDAATAFTDKPMEQLGAPLYCIAVEENCNKGRGGTASRSAQKSPADLIRAINVS